MTFFLMTSDQPLGVKNVEFPILHFISTQFCFVWFTLYN